MEKLHIAVALLAVFVASRVIIYFRAAKVFCSMYASSYLLIPLCPAANKLSSGLAFPRNSNLCLWRCHSDMSPKPWVKLAVGMAKER